MRILKVGSSGSDVQKVQAALNDIFEEQIETDGEFGPQTEAMVMAFQEDQGLDADGEVGPLTWTKLFNEPVKDDGQEEPTGIIRQSQLTQLFGSPTDPAPYLKVMNFSEFAPSFGHVRSYDGSHWSCKIYGHKMMEVPLRRAFKALVDGGLAKELKTYDGCVNIRRMTGGGGMSVHSWGLAVDFNAASNPYGAKPTFSAGFVKCFTDAGFEWGGNWNTPDGMHFQLPRTRG